ncbi:MAG: N-6 DNA methylase [Sedimentisphaerales bacterium]|nr:N-6 DNA methylase [Sedimentisphaerales bacterium]
MTRDLIDSYSSVVDSGHRREYGQFFTPPEIAAFMCRWALSAGSPSLYDPAFGLGSFYFAATSITPSINFTGMELDTEILNHFNAYAHKKENLTVACRDYLTQWGWTCQAIVCNPPYMRFQHFINRSKVFASFERNLRIRLSGYTNIASAFLLKSLSELRHNGRLAYIMPLEFLNTGYGAIIKERLLHNGTLKALIKLEAEKEVFPDVTTSVGIILASNDGVIAPVRFYVLKNLRDLSDILSTCPMREVSAANLNPSEKWLKYFENGHVSFCSPDLVSIDFYGRFTRGIATGANEFFTMSRSKAEKLGIARECFISCITKSAQVRTPVFTQSNYEELERIDANVLLLNVTGEPTGEIHNYVQYGEKMGFHLRYLTKMRTPWFKLERRKPAPLLFGVFSREKFKVVRNFSSAINLTCYHCFYPNLFGRQVCDALFLYFQSKAARQILSISMRHYGDGLEKFEPNDLNFALAPSPGWLSKLAPDAVKNAIKYCAKHKTLPKEVEAIFDPLTRFAERSTSKVISTPEKDKSSCYQLVPE